MENFLYTYLNNKYGLKNLIIEWAVAIVNGIVKHASQDHDVRLFGKILKNECDEEFRFIQMHVRETLTSLVRVMLRDRFQFKGEREIQRMVDGICTGGGVIEEWMWRRVIDKMYDAEDATILEKRFMN